MLSKIVHHSYKVSVVLTVLPTLVLVASGCAQEAPDSALANVKPVVVAESAKIPDDTNFAFQKTYVSSDVNKFKWGGGLTDGSWESDADGTFATGDADTYPKTVTIDLEQEKTIGTVLLGVPSFGSTKTIEVSLSTDKLTFTPVGRHVFTLRQEEKHLFTFAATQARYVRLNYLDHYSEPIRYQKFVFTTEVEVYAPGVKPASIPANTKVSPPSALEAADMPMFRKGRDGKIASGYVKLHESFLQRGKDGKIGVLFLGDSITAGWATKSGDIWQKYYGAYDPANFGIGRERTQNVLWRIANGELDGIEPKVLVLMLGTNNSTYPVEEIIKGDKKVIAEIHRKLPKTKLLLLGIFPRGAKASDPVVAAVRAKLATVNAELARLDDGDKTRYLYIGSKFLDSKGDISQDIMPDALHPNVKGYQIWADAMKPLLDEMMK